MEFKIRSEAEDDAEAIERVTIDAFRNVEHSDQTEHFIVAALRRAGALTISLVARSESGVVGHVAVSPVRISDGSPGWFGLGPISVLPDVQRQGVGSALMHAALSELRHRGAVGCVLVGDPDYYHRFGFRCVESLRFPDVPAEYFQVVSFGGVVPDAEVEYHEAFNATE